jgi:hypothetical protein
VTKRTCKKCSEEKSIELFVSNRNCASGYEYECKACAKIRKTQWDVPRRAVRMAQAEAKAEERQLKRAADKVLRQEARREYKRRYYASNKDRIYQQNKESDKRNYQRRAARRRESARRRMQTSIQSKLAKRLRNRIWSAVKYNKAGSSVRDLGCSLEFLKSYLEARFQPGMTWDNWGHVGSNVWHLDHVTALANFDLTNREQFLKACHYTNLQPLWAIDNIKKGAKF